MEYEQLTLWEEPKLYIVPPEERVTYLPPVYGVQESRVPTYPPEAFEKPFSPDINVNQANLYRAYQAARRLLKLGYEMSSGIMVNEETANMNVSTLASLELASTFKGAFEASIADGVRIGPYMLDDGERLTVLRGIGLWKKRKASALE